MMVLSLLLLGAYFPPLDGGVWETATDEVAGVNAVLLDEAMVLAGERNSRGVVILHQGKILREQYWGDWNQDVRGPAYSVTKSVVATLIGIAIEEGSIEGVAQKSADFLEEWSGDSSKEEITIGHHLGMVTGLRENPLDSVFLQGAISERTYAAGLASEFEPGTRWYYHNPAYRLCFYILEEATGMATDSYLQDRLFDRIGMSNSELLVRETELPRRTFRNYQFVTWSARDAARFGLLILREGAWGEEQVVACDWVQEMMAPAMATGDWYGSLWWRNGSEHHEVPLRPELRTGALFPDVPADAVAALGKDDQKVYVVPSLDLVVVRLGEAADASTPAVSVFDNEFLGRICRAFGFEGEEQKVDLELKVNEGVSLGFETWNGRQYLLEKQTGLGGDWEEVGRVTGDGLKRVLSLDLEEQMFFQVR